jgi:transcriptional regulator with XRE-family HTH domain
MKYIQKLRFKERLSEQALAELAKLSRLTVRQLELGEGNPTLKSLSQVADALEHTLLCFAVPKDKPGKSELSIVATAMKITAGGFDSWPLHLMELVDEFRREPDLRLLLLPPPRGTESRILALMASTSLQLCEETGLEAPYWATQSYFLDEPWFISETESLKAFALLESPYAFRKNNIFVQSNFLARA